MTSHDGIQNITVKVGRGLGSRSGRGSRANIISRNKG
jgi:hypothetical protein